MDNAGKPTRKLTWNARKPLARQLMKAEPGLDYVVALARERVNATEVWLFGSRARGEADGGSDWDILILLPDDASDADLDPGRLWRIGRDAGLTADVLADREADIRAAAFVPNTIAYVLAREGVRLG